MTSLSALLDKRYQVIDGKTKKQVGTTYKCRKRCGTRAEKLNLEYGAHRYYVR